ncbi:MAG: HD domain-containing protein [Proteobacteria bacterium]|nr:HD domain-containing protein [Pseudomonadota bacterium]MBU1060721.1 HD domain-containing protein [Pseudomonadota bacterium]
MIQAAISQANLLPTLAHLNALEEERLSPAATLSAKALRRKEEKRIGYRQSFALDADRIIHSRAYTRYIDKTQVFCLIANDHITHRVLHVQLVSRIARTIGRFLALNEDLIEAIALGHDIGHPPFGHDGESFLAELCTQHNLPPFQHNIQSVRFLDRLERKGRGWNLSLQTLDGILCHDGEIHANRLSPTPDKDFAALDLDLERKKLDPKCRLAPMSLEGCVVRMADTVAYIGRDIEDAILLGLIDRKNIPAVCRKQLGSTNGEIVYTLVTDLIANSFIPSTTEKEKGYIGFSDQVAALLKELKDFNYTNIYLHPLTKKNLPLIQNCYETLFTRYLAMLENREAIGPVDLMTDMDPSYLATHTPAAMVCDFIAGMTDNFFLMQAANAGCKVPEKQ